MSTSFDERATADRIADPLPPLPPGSLRLIDLPQLTRDYLDSVQIRLNRVTGNLVPGDEGTFSVMRTRKHFGVYPYSGRVPAIVAESVDDLDYDKGTIRFQPERPLSDDTIRAIVAARVAEIDDPSLRRRTQPG